MKVFISSVFTDKMISIRKKLRELVSSYKNYDPVDLSNDIPKEMLNDNVIKESIDGVKECEYFILLIDSDYSKSKFSYDRKNKTLYKNGNTQNKNKERVKIEYDLSSYFQEEEQLSITQLEYRIAKQLDKYIFVFYSENSENEFFKEVCDYNKPQCIKMKDGKDAEHVAYDILLTIFHDYYDRVKNRYRITKNIDNTDTHFNIITHIGTTLKNYNEIRKIIVKDKKIDTKYLYLSDESVKEWQKWELNNNNNTITKSSVESFKNILESNEFKDILLKLDTIVDLGVGQGEKLNLLLNKITDHYAEFQEDGKILNHLNIIPLDFSIAMIDDAISSITNNLKNNKYKELFLIDGLKMDMMELKKAKTILNGSKTKSTLYMLLGGTIGNLDEEEFLKNLANVSESGDYFIVTIFLFNEEVIKDNKIPDYTEAIKKVYGPSFKEMRYNISKVCMCKQEYEEILDIRVLTTLKDIETGESIDNVEILKSTRYKKEYFDKLIKKYYEEILYVEDEQKIAATYLLKKKNN